MKRNKKIGSFSNQFLIEDFTKKFHEYMNTDLVLYFFWCIYDEKEIAAKFEFSDGILSKRKVQMHFIEIMARDSEIYTVNYILTLIKNTIPKLYPSLPSLGTFRKNVEDGKFTGCDDEHILSVAYRFADDYFNHRSLGGSRWDLVIRDGAPRLNAVGGEWKQIISVTPYNPNVDYNKDYQVDMWGFMVDTDTGTKYVDENGKSVSTPKLAPGTILQDPIGDPAITANRTAWNTKLKPVNMYGDFDINEFGYMVSQTDPTQYVTVYGVKTAAKQLVNGLLKELVPVTDPGTGTGTGTNTGFSLSSVGIPMLLVAGGLVISFLKRNKKD